MRPRVSILIPCYNAAEWIEEAVSSALFQTYDNTEVIVVDDGSTDDSLTRIRRFGDGIIYEGGSNRGGNAARNRLLEISTGEWVQFLDADDFLRPEKIEAQIEVALHAPADVIFGPSTIRYEQESHQELLPISEPHDPWRLLALWELPQTGSPLWRRQALLDVGGWKEDQAVCQEHELYLRLLMAGKRFLYTDDGGSVYRQWSPGTVCRRDLPNTYRHRLAIMRKAELYLLDSDQMTASRREAFDAAYLACSRIIWTFDRSWASEIMMHVDDVHEGRYRPDISQVPYIYSWLYRQFGFSAAESIAAIKRTLIRG